MHLQYRTLLPTRIIWLHVTCIKWKKGTYNFRVQHYLFFKDFGLNELVTATCLCLISPLFCLTEFWWLWNFMNRFACKPHKPCLQTCSGGCAQKIGRLCQRFGKDKDRPASFPYIFFHFWQWQNILCCDKVEKNEKRKLSEKLVIQHFTFEFNFWQHKPFISSENIRGS